MAEEVLNYFVCTLGQAAVRNQKHPHSFETINDLIDQQAERFPDAGAIGIPNTSSLPRPTRGPWSKGYLTYKELRDYSITSATRLAHVLSILGDQQGRTVALLSATGPRFVMAWLGLVRLGLSVLLIAPQLENPAIEHLCNTCGAVALFYENRYSQKAEQLQGDITTINLGRVLQLSDLDTSAKVEGRSKADDVAYLHHTSGTSTGLPKAIPQTHRAAVGVLPSFQDGPKSATFSTTPLYHGGIADCFRSWTSGSMIWLFPEAKKPLTVLNISSCLELSEYLYDRQSLPKVEYFSSVPYVLESLADDKGGMKWLASMKAVGVGGAALPPAIGDRLVKSGINLLSRFGSAECGFLMSSFRKFEEDPAWQYLRPGVGSEYLQFESKDDGLSELIVKPGWPHMAKKNREDGSYATSDLFEPHPTIANAWRYHSRADSQITLKTGKKFDPAPLETAIVSLSNVLHDVLVFGNGENYPGALLFPKPDINLSADELVNDVWPIVDQMNQDSQSHTRISKDMLVAMPVEEGGTPLEKSSKGTILRAKAEERYLKEIEMTYKGDHETTEDAEKTIPAWEIEPKISQIVDQVLGRHIESGSDLFDQHVDSMACIRIRGLIEQQLLPRKAGPLPLNVVYDCGTIESLADFISKRIEGQDLPSDDEELKLMTELVDEYGDFKEFTADATVTNGHTSERPSGNVVVLTGVTGALGAHILHTVRNDPTVSKVYCLLRAESPFSAGQRLRRSLRARGLPDQGRIRGWLEERIVPVPCKLSDPNLGLSDEVYNILVTSATMVIHAAWAVNFDLRLKSFVKDHIRGTRHLINFATKASKHRSSPTAFIFISSTASVIKHSSTLENPIPERISTEPMDASPLGYSRSKWVTENICSRAYQHFSSSPTANGTSSATASSISPNISVIRVGQLCGDSRFGIWNVSEAYPLLISTAKITNCLPDLPNEILHWLPVNFAAHAVVQIAFKSITVRKETAQPPQEDQATDGTKEEPTMPVYHVLTPYHYPLWSELLRYINEYEHKYNNGRQIEITTPEIWLERLESKLESLAEKPHPNSSESYSTHPAAALLDLWKKTYLPSYTTNPPPLTVRTSMVSLIPSTQIIPPRSILDPTLPTPSLPPGPFYSFTRTFQYSDLLREILEFTHIPLNRVLLVRLYIWINRNVALEHRDPQTNRLISFYSVGGAGDPISPFWRDAGDWTPEIRNEEFNGEDVPEEYRTEPRKLVALDMIRVRYGQEDEVKRAEVEEKPSTVAAEASEAAPASGQESPAEAAKEDDVD